MQSRERSALIPFSCEGMSMGGGARSGNRFRATRGVGQSVSKMTTAAPVRVEGALDKIVYRDDAKGFAVAQLTRASGEVVTIRGNLLGAHVGEAVRVAGQWIDHPRFGRQLRVESVEVVPPSTEDGLKAYLASGLVPGVGPAIAARIVARFGAETLEVIERTPKRLLEVEGIGRKRLKDVVAAIAGHRGLRELVAFLAMQGVGVGAAQRIWTHYGPDSLRLVRENPYRLADEVRGFGFWTADAIAERLGVARDSVERAIAGVVFALSEAAGVGHTCLPEDELIERASRLLDQAEPLGRRGLEGALGAGGVARETLGGSARLYLPALLAAERAVASRLRVLLGAKLPPPLADAGAIEEAARRARIALHPHQRTAVASALRERVLVITGGPGVGKTTIVRLIVDLAVARRHRVLLASPTGRAARRLQEATRKPASTIHRLLDFNPRDGSFGRNDERPLDAEVVIVDEASMIDVSLAASLLRAIRPPTRLVLVGDADQLPSVGPGNVLSDLLECAGIAVVRLTEIFRQGGGSAIVEGAHRILAGRVPEFSKAPAGAGDLFFIEREDPLEALGTVIQVVTERIPGRYKLDPRRDVQVISPMYRGEVGVDRLNDALRERLNPSGPSLRVGARVLRQGDRVMVTRNDAERDVFNGDVGRVVSVTSSPTSLLVELGGRTVPFGPSQLGDLAPAYAISVHRSQGSEYPAVVIPLVTQHFVMLRRPLLYTAVTRAKRVGVLVGSRRALDIAVHDARMEDRYSLLRERLRAE